MRKLVFLLLLAVPVTVVGAFVYIGLHPPPPEKEPAAPSSAKAGGDPALLALFDGPLGGAKVKEKVALYDEKTLFDYVNGAAPTFLERGFRKLAAAELVSADGSDLVCDVFDMGKPANATAMFEKERAPSAKPVDGWANAVTASMAFVFQAGPYYVKLTAFDARSEAALPALAGALREKIR